MSTMISANPAQVVLQGTSSIPVTSQLPLVEGTIPQSQQAFPVRTFKIFGGIQIGLGVLLGILSIIGVVFDSIAMNKYNDCYSWYFDSQRNFNHYNYGCFKYKHSRALFAFDVTCMICAGWYILTGFLPMCMSRKRIDSWRCLKVAFMSCSIIGASLFVPVMFGLGVIGALMRTQYDRHVIVLSAFIAVLTFIEFVIAIVSSVFCCCCSPSGATNQPINVVYLNASQPGIVMNLPQTHIPMGTTQHTMMSATQYPRAHEYQVPVGVNQTHTQTSNQHVNTHPPDYKL